MLGDVREGWSVVPILYINNPCNFVFGERERVGEGKMWNLRVKKKQSTCGWGLMGDAVVSSFFVKGFSLLV